MQPSVAYDPDEDRYLVVWTCDYSEDGSFFWVYVRFVNWDGSFATTDYPLRIADEDMFFPRVAYGGSTKEFFVTWWTRGEGTFKDAIWVHKIPADTPTTGSAVVTISGPEDRNYPDIAFNQARNEYIIVYQKATASGGDVMGIRLQGNGTVLGTGEFGIAEWPDDEGAPRIAASRVSNRWAVVWHSQVRPADRDAFARLLWIDGSNTLQMSSPVVVQGTTGDNVNPDIAAYPESSTFLITSSEQYTTGYLGIVARPFYASNVLGPIFDIRMGVAGFSQLPSVAGGKTGWMMVWQQDRDAAGTYQDIHGRIFFSEIFSDGFELGNTTRWSSTVP